MEYKILQNKELSPALRQGQRMVASQEMQRALLWLQLPQLELSEELELELETNPLLEIEEENGSIDELQEENSSHEEEAIDFDKDDFSALLEIDDSFSDLFEESSSPTRTKEDEKLLSFKESLIQESLSLGDVLNQESKETFENEADLYASRILIGYLDERGFLTTPLKEIEKAFSIPLSRLKRVLEVIKSFDPPGVGASTLQESLELQLIRKGKGEGTAFHIIHQFFPELLGNKIPIIAQKLGISLEEVIHAIDEDISCLDLHPGTRFSKKPIPYIIADLIITDKEGSLVAELSRERIPNLKLNRKYLGMMSSPSLSKEERQFLKTKAHSAKWLLKTLSHRASTLELIGNALIRLQREFFLSKTGQLKPMTMHKLAEELELHESTIARAVSNKYVDCPKGVLPLRSFFTSDFSTSHGESISSKTVKELMQELIDHENKQKPLSDEKIAEIIQAKGIQCARRTVAKFRMLLGIGNTRERRKWIG